MSSYLTIKKNDQWVVYWDRNKLTYESWYNSLGFTNCEWKLLAESDVYYVIHQVEEDLNNRNDWVQREKKVYNDLLASHASLVDIQKQMANLSDAKKYRNELYDVLAELHLVANMIDQSNNDDKWEWQIG